MSRTGRGTRRARPERCGRLDAVRTDDGHGPDRRSPVDPGARRRKSHRTPDSAVRRRASLRRRGRVDLGRLEPGAPKHRQGRVARVGRLGQRALASPEHRSTPGLDPPSVAARPAQARRGAGVASARVAHRAVRLAERVGFEPTKSFDSALFKSAAINRSATSPGDRISREPPGSPASGRPRRAAQGCLTTIVPAMRSCQPRRRLSMKIQM